METLKALVKSRRMYYIWIPTAVLLGWLYYTDPDRGGSLRDMLEGLATVGLAFTLAHIFRKFFFHYIKLEDHAAEAKKGNVGSGLVVLAMVLFVCVAALIFSTRAHAQDVRTYIPPLAKTYCPVLLDEQKKLFSNHSAPEALCSLVEKESCISLTHSRCWSPTASLKTAREFGQGFGQITKAYNPNGSLRFDALADTRALDPTLADWSWSNNASRPDLQLRGIVVTVRQCVRRLSKLVSSSIEVLHMCDSAYNGGFGGLKQERRACYNLAGCDPQKWFGNVELTCLKSKVRWKGYGQSACEINRGHVDSVFLVRRAKYNVFVKGF
jgi:hypothetical protein